MIQETLEREIREKIRHYETTLGEYTGRCNRLAAYLIPGLFREKSMEGIVRSASLKDLTGLSENYEEALKLVQGLHTIVIAMNQTAAIYRSQTGQGLPEDIEGFLKRNCGINQVIDLQETQRHLSNISTDLKYAIQDHQAVHLDKDAKKKNKRKRETVKR